MDQERNPNKNAELSMEQNYNQIDGIERRKIMSIYPWIEKIDFQKFAMPLVVKRDNEYYPGIVEKLADLVFELERCGASDKIVLAVKEFADLRRAREDVQALWNQFVYQKRHR